MSKAKNSNHQKNIKSITKKPRKFMLINELPIYEIGGFIDKKTAKNYSKNYLKNKPFIGPDGEPLKGHLFGKGNLSKLINQPDCHGIRVYYGMKKTKQGLIPQLMMVGVYQDGNDMIDHTLILDMTMPCPWVCPPDESIFQ